MVGWSVDGRQFDGKVLLLPPEQSFDWSSSDPTALAYVSGEAADDRSRATIVQALQDLIDAGAHVLGQFQDADSFKRLMSEIMTPRVGFESLEAWQGNPNALDAEDGKLIPQDWPLWSQALIISDPRKVVTLGEVSGSAIAVLQMYLGTKWGTTASTAHAKRKQVEAKLSGVTRRKARDSEARQESLRELRQSVANLESRIEALPDSDSLERIDKSIEDARARASILARAEGVVALAAQSFGEYARQLEEAEMDLVAVQEAAMTRLFWHSLEPTCCPRCDTKVNKERLRREAAGNCSLCDSDLSTTPLAQPTAADSLQPADSDDMEPDEIVAAQDRVLALEARVAVASSAHDVALQSREKARTEFEDAKVAAAGVDVDPSTRREMELELASVRGRLVEREYGSAQVEDHHELEQAAAILGAADYVATGWKLEDQKVLLDDVSRQITTLARSLGVAQLESATFKSNTHLDVVKGGAPMKFGRLPAGEQLRFKIAIVIALMRVGGVSGVNRHPGLLLVDSFAREEMSPANAAATLQALQSIAVEFGIQVVTSSANGDLVASVLPTGATRMSRESDDLLW